MTRASTATLIVLVSIVAAYASESTESLTRRFHSLCIAGPLSFSRIESEASRMKWAVEREEQNPSRGDGGFLHIKSWAVPIDVHIQNVVAAEGQSRNGEIKACGVSAAGLVGSEVKAELIRLLGLGKPVHETTLPNGSAWMSVWRFGPDELNLMFIDETSPIRPSVNVVLSTQLMAGF